MQLATDATDFSTGALGLVELALSHLNDRSKRMFSKAEMVEYANIGQQDIANEINRYSKEYFQTYATTDTVADQAIYALPSAAVSVLGIEVRDDATDRNHQELHQVLFRDKDFYERLDVANSKEDMGFFFVYGTSFALAPEIDTAGLKMRVHYIKRLDTLANNTDISEIPLEHHPLIALEMARYGYIKFRRVNGLLEKMRDQAMERLHSSIRQFTPHAEEHVEPFHGTYGPTVEILDLFRGGT